MKIIDLLVKIANGEEVPKKLNYMGETYLKTQYDDTQNFMIDYLSEESENAFFDTYNISAIINDEVEIIEEDKKIDKKINKYDTGLDNGSWNEESVKKGILEKNNIEDYLVRVMKEVDNVKFKVFEIIDYLQSKGE